MTDAAAPDAAEPDAPPATVLVVEDEALVAMLVADMLAEAGHRPVCTPDGRTGLPASGSGAGPSAAVVDLRLADGLDGRCVVRDLRGRRPDLPVVVVTGFHPEAPQADLRGLGGPTLRLCKPFDQDELAGGVAAVMAAPAVPATPRRRRSDALKEPA